MMSSQMPKYQNMCVNPSLAVSNAMGRLRNGIRRRKLENLSDGQVSQCTRLMGAALLKQPKPETDSAVSTSS